jgi:Flp pilus assembly secretin CpaC
MQQLMRMAAMAVTVVMVMMAAAISSTARATTSDLIVLTLVATNGEAGELSHRTRQYLVTDFDAEGPVTEVIDTGCRLEFQPNVSGSDIGVFLRLVCTLLDQPVATTSVSTDRGRQLIQQPVLDSFEVETSFTSRDGETTALDEPGSPLILVTVRRIRDVTLTAPQVSIEVKILAGGAGPPGGSPLSAELRLIADSGLEGRLSDRTERHFVNGFRAGYPVTSSFSTGCQGSSVPVALASGNVLTTFSQSCSTVDEPIATFQVRTRSGPQLIQQPVIRTLSLSTQVDTQDGQTIVLGGVQEGAQAALAFLTVRAVQGETATEQFLVESRVAASGMGDPPADGASYLAELNVTAVLGESGLLNDFTRRSFVTGLRPDGPQKTALVSGCDLTTQALRPGADPNELSLKIDSGCNAIEDPVQVVEVRTPHGPQDLQLPTIHRLRASSAVTLQDGGTVVLAGLVANGNEETLILVTPRLLADVLLRDQVGIEARIVSIVRDGEETLLGSPATRVLERPSLTIADGATGMLSDRTERSFVAHAHPGQPVTDRVHGGCVFQSEPLLQGDPNAPHVLANAALECESIDQPLATFPIATPRGLQHIQLPVVHGLQLRTRVEMQDGQTLRLGGLLSESPSADPALPPRERQESIVLLTSDLVRDGTRPSQVRVEALLLGTSDGAAESEAGMAGPSFLQDVALLTRPDRESALDEFAQGFFVTDFGRDGPIVTAEHTGCSLITHPTFVGDPNEGSLRLASDIVCRALDEEVETFQVKTLEGNRNVQLPVAHTLGVKTTVDVSNGQTLVLGGLSSDDEEALVFVTPRLVVGDHAPQVQVAARLVRQGVNGEPDREGFSTKFLKEVELSTQLGVPATLTDFMTEEVVVGFERGEPLVSPLNLGFELTFTPTLLGNGAISVDLQFACDAVDEDEGPSSQRRKPQVERAFGHALRLDTAFEAAPGDTVVIGSALNGGEILIVVTPRLPPSPPSTKQEVLLELRLLRVSNQRE